MEGHSEIMAGLASELRRGTVVLGVLTLLTQPTYGWSLIAQMEELGLPADGNTLYPLLRRLEKQGLLKSEWETAGAKPRKYYVITPEGDEVRRELSGQWYTTVESMTEILGR